MTATRARSTALAVAAAAVLVAGACTTGSAQGPTPVTGAPTAAAEAGSLPTPDHVVIVVFENKDYDQVVGSPAAPYLSGLARSGANFTDAHGEWHPSQPNYIALLSGSTHGVTDDSCPQELGDQPNLARQLLDAGRSFVGYSEGMPSPGFAGCGYEDQYARKHNSWVDFTNVPGSSNLPFSAFPADFAALPTVAVVVPDLCHDMHDCPVAAGDDWARQHLDAYVRWARDHNSLLVVTFDEDDGSKANHIATLFVGPMVRPGAADQPINHYSILRTVEAMYHLPALGQAATTPAITTIW
jgi:phosphatidylinositol-3-phosphatase